MSSSTRAVRSAHTNIEHKEEGEHPSAISADGSDLTTDMSDAIERVGYGKFQQRTLLPMTGLTLLADAMVSATNTTQLLCLLCMLNRSVLWLQELMLLPFLTLGVECEWGAASRATHPGASTEAPISDLEISWISTAVFIGMLIGALLSGLMSDRIGRRPTVLILTACTGIFGLLSAFSSSFSMLLVSRAFVGVGVGGSPAALSLFTEFLPKEKRGEYLIHYVSRLKMSSTCFSPTSEERLMSL